MKLDYDTLIFLTKAFRRLKKSEKEHNYYSVYNRGIDNCIAYMKGQLETIHTKENAEWHKAKQEEPPEVIQELEKLIKQQIP